MASGEGRMIDRMRWGMRKGRIVWIGSRQGILVVWIKHSGALFLLKVALALHFHAL